jgi:curved DNA-binding protein CbpA
MTDFIDYNELSKIDLYDLLNVNQISTYDDIRRGFKKLANRLHPDKNPNQTQEDKEKYDNIQVAYYILSDEHRRKKYDDYRKNHQDMFYSLKNQSQKKVVEKPSKVDFELKAKELEKQHFEGVNFQDVDTNTRLSKQKQERSAFNFPKPRINDLKDRVDGKKFNEIFNKEVEDTKSYDIVEYKGDALTSTGNYIQIDQFEKLYTNSGSERVFKNNYSTINEAYSNKFIRTNNNFDTHNYRDKEYTRELTKKMDIYRRDFFTNN